VLRAWRINVHLYGRHADKMRIAEPAGAQTAVIKRKVPASAYDWVVEATGSEAGLRQAVQMTRPRGTIVMKSTLHGMVPVDTASVIVNEITLVGSRLGRFEPALNLLRSHSINVLEMISDSLPLSQAPRAFARAAERGVLKVLLNAG
jgi:alcohol dehydrogenase